MFVSTRVLPVNQTGDIEMQHSTLTATVANDVKAHRLPN